MKLKNKPTKEVIIYFGVLSFIIILLLLVASSNSSSSFMINNINNTKSIETSRREAFNNFQEDSLGANILEAIKVFSIPEAISNKDKLVEFTGTLTGYGPDCVGCNGKLGCDQSRSVKDGNIYYEDAKYGTLRILAADRSIPCGSIVKISNFKFIDGDFYGIVLDHGSAVNGLTMDLLYSSEEETKSLGRSYNINFQIERWGY